MKNKIFKNVLKFILFFLFLNFTQLIYSQPDIETATRETDRLMRQEEELKRLLRPVPKKPAEIKTEEEIVKKEEKKFFIKKINLVGCESFPLEEFSFLLEKYENKEISLVDLEILAKDIEQEYLKKGVIAACFVPPQEIKDQTVTLQVVEARLGEIQIQDHKYFKKERLLYYWQIAPDEVLRYDKISKSTKLMSKNPDREVKVSLQAGKKPATTDVILIPKTRWPLHFTSSFDKEGALSTGKNRIGGGFRHNNFLGFDDMLLAGYTFGDDFSGFYTYHNLPISPYGSSLIYGYSKSQSKPQKDFASYGISSKAEGVSISFYQDLYQKDNYWGEFYLTFDAKDKTIIMNTGTYNRDRLRIFRLGANFLIQDLLSSTYILPEFSQGVEAFGASKKNNPLASRGAKSSFNKFKFDLQHKRTLPFDLKLVLKFKSQFTHQKLFPQEEFSLGGINSVRGYPPDDYLADNALLTNLELLIPSFFIPKNWRLPYADESLKEQATLVTFLDYGHGSRLQPSGSERKSKDLLSWGLGLRLSLFEQALLRLEWGFPIGGNRPITESGDSRFHFAVDFQEKFPEELARIQKLMEEEKIKKLAEDLIDQELMRQDSPLRKKIIQDLNLASAYYKEGLFKEAKDIYFRIIQLCRSLVQQAEDYVRDCLEKEKKLKQDDKLAKKYYQLGKFTEAKAIWEKIVQEAKPKSLVLEF